MKPSAYFRVVGPWANTPYLLTHDGWLLAFVEHEGRDPDGRGDADYATALLSHLNARGNLPREVRVQDYLVHAVSPVPEPRERQGEVITRLLQARKNHLQRKRLYKTRLMTVIGINTESMSGHSSPTDIVTWLLAAPFDKRSRSNLKRALSFSSSHTFLSASVHAAATRMRDTIQTYTDRLSINDRYSILDTQAVWNWCRVLATTNTEFFENPSPPPTDHWYLSLAHGDQSIVTHEGMDYWVDSVSGTHARIASVTRFDERTEPGFWVRHNPPIIGADGNFILAVNATRLSPVREAMAFKMAQDGIDRANLNLSDLVLGMFGKARKDGVPDPTLARQQKELTEAQSLGDAWWDVSATLVAFDRSPELARKTALALDNACSQAGVTATWESPLLVDTHRGIQPGMPPLGPRAHLFNTPQLSAVSMAWAHSQGESAVADLGGEEPLYWLETKDGQLFGFSPFIGEKSTVFVVGPTRSGKTFFKNAVLSHWAKYNGALVCYDYDSGSECIAHLYGDDAALFRGGHGFNPFASYRVGSNTFRPHFSRLIATMLASNSDPAMQRMDDGDQLALDTALSATLLLPTTIRTFGSFVEHLPQRLREKLSRWYRGGEARYAPLMDSNVDRVGLIDRAVTVFSVPELRDDAAARIPVATECFYRTTCAFEDPSRRTQVKAMALDEAHLILKDPMFARFLDEKARTLAKHRGSLWLLSQQPHEFLAVENWEAIRTAASTYIFTAAPELDRTAYKAAFNLTDADMTQISQLMPKREIYLVQPETGLRKVLILDADPYTAEFASSTANVVAEREARIEQLGFEAAMQHQPQTAHA